MKLSIRISLVIGTISMVVASIVAGASYYLQLNQASSQSQHLVNQLAQSASKTSAIAAYLNDTELAREILLGLIANDLIAGASINIDTENADIEAGSIQASTKGIDVTLINPFIENDKIGLLTVYPRDRFIEQQASYAGIQNALFLLILSVVTAIIVGLYVRGTLTRPLRMISNELSKVDTTKPDTMKAINFNYKNRDEIGSLTDKTNTLITALQQRFKSEIALRKTTEDLQNRFRLIFEQSTAGIALLDQESLVTLANPAFDELFGQATQNNYLAQYFEDPQHLLAGIEQINRVGGSAQIELDLVSYSSSRKRYLHCLLSSITESREGVRTHSKDLIELIVYDVTQRREKEQKAQYEAAHDPLTGLLNRRAGQAWIDDALTQISSARPLFAIMMIDLDKFKPINDIYGHDAGDVVLVDVSKNIVTLAQKNDATTIRWGGDEFLIALSESSVEKIEAFAEQVLSAIRQPVAINQNQVVSVGASIGLIILHESQKNEYGSQKLIRKADELMYHTKRHNKDSVQIINLYNHESA